MPTFPKPDLKVDLKPLYAGAGVTDLAVERVRAYVAEAQLRLAGAQKRVSDVDLEPQALRDQATAVVNARVDALAKDLPAKLQAFVDENITVVNDVYGDLATRGEGLVTRIRNQESSQATASSAQTTTAKAKTTQTQATKAAKSTTKSTAKKATTTAKKKSAAPKSSAKATGTAAKKTASSAAQAAGDGAAKVGD